MEKYEIEGQYFPDKPVKSLIATLTGLEERDIDEKVNLGESFTGPQLAEAFQSLGFNTSKYIKFDPLTEFPCVLRVQARKGNSWHIFGYYDFFLYTCYPDSTWRTKFQWKYINRKYYLILNDDVLKITSMLQVWI